MNKLELIKNQIELFNVATSETETKLNSLNENSFIELLKNGILIDVKILKTLNKQDQKNLTQFLIKKYGVSNEQIGASFYNTFAEVSEATDDELLINQLLHYLSTYGGVDQLKNNGQVYTPNQERKINESLKKFKEIKSIGQLQMINLIVELAEKDVPLSEKDVEMLHDLICYYKEEIKISELDIKNKELLCRLYETFKIIPNNGPDFVRLLVYLTIGSTTLIKSKDVINGIKYVVDGLNLRGNNNLIEYLFKEAERNHLLTEYSKTFNRFKPLYLSFKKLNDKEVKRIINKLNRLSKNYHEPMQQDILANGIDLLIKGETTLDKIAKKVKNAETYKIVKILNAVLLKNNELSEDKYSKTYRIRNGKSYTTRFENNLPSKEIKNIKDDLEELSKILLLELTTRTKEKIGDLKVYLPSNVTYAVPTSTKTFVGHIPEMSYVDVEDNFAVGISWSDPADIDLSGYSARKNIQISWNASDRDEKHHLLYSGDMTGLDKTGNAHESIFVNKELYDNVVFNQVLYSAWDCDNSTIDAKLNISDYINPRNYQTKENVKISLPFISENAGKTFAISTLPDEENRRKIFLTNTSVGHNTVFAPTLADDILDALERKLNSMLTIKELLKLSNVEIISDEERKKLIEDETEFIDLSTETVSKNDFLKLI